MAVQAAVAAINLTVLAPQMAQVLSSVQAGAVGQEALTLRGHEGVPGVVTLKVVVVREVFPKVRQAVQALHAIMVAMMAEVVVGEPALQLQVWVGQEATQAEAGAAAQVVTSALQG